MIRLLDLAQRVKDSQKIKRFPGSLMIEGWSSQKQLSGPVERKKKEKTPVSSSKALIRFNILQSMGIACRKMVY